MGEPNTYKPKINLHADTGVIEFVIDTEGLKVSFDIDADDAERIAGRLEYLRGKYYARD